MSDMSQLYKAYAAVHNKDIKTELTESKDEISGMNLNSLMSSDLIDITEEIVQSMFESGFDVKDTKAVIAHIFESAQSGFVTEVRQNKIERLQEAFYKTFQKVTEKSPKIAVEAFINYRNQKPLVEKWDNRVSHEFDNSKTHKSLVAEDRKRVLDGLMDMVLRGMDEVFDEGKKLAAPDHDPVGQEDKDIDNDGDHDKTDKYLLNRRKVIGKAITTRKEEVEIDEATAMAKRGYDETKLRKPAGGGAAADRATALEKKPTYGDSSKEAQRSRYARAQRGDFRKTASSSPGLHGYGHKSDDPAVKAKQAARGAQRSALTPAEKKQLNREEFDLFDLVLEFLQVEGFAETLEEAKWIMANELDEEAIAIIAEASCEDDEDEKEMKKDKKSKKSEEDEEGEEELDEASYSAKAARAGKDIGKPGKAFAKIAKSAAKRYGSKERGEKVAGAVLAKLRAKRG